MKKFIQSILVIVVGLVVMFLTSWLLDIKFIADKNVRIYLVYLIMLLELFISIRLIQAINKEPDTKS